jgi:hypothetical protein
MNLFFWLRTGALTVFLVIASRSALGSGGSVLLISDVNDLTGVETNLIGDGYTVTSISNDFVPLSTNGPASSMNLTNINFLMNFDMVVWGASGEGFGVLHPNSVHMTMEEYIQRGGHLLVAGHDTLASPIDTNMANLVRSTTTDDVFLGQTNFTTVGNSHFVLHGPFGDFRNTTINPCCGSTPQTSFTTAGINHFVLNGSFGDYRNMTVTPGPTSWQGAVPDPSQGGDRPRHQ